MGIFWHDRSNTTCAGFFSKFITQQVKEVMLVANLKCVKSTCKVQIIKNENRPDLKTPAKLVLSPAATDDDAEPNGCDSPDTLSSDNIGCGSCAAEAGAETTTGAGATLGNTDCTGELTICCTCAGGRYIGGETGIGIRRSGCGGLRRSGGGLRRIGEGRRCGGGLLCNGEDKFRRCSAGGGLRSTAGAAITVNVFCAMGTDKLLSRIN